MSSAPDIFLSYNREDQAVARRFAEAFEREGLNVWWDVTLRSGEAYDQVTEQALRSARAVVVLWSKKSVDSRWVRAEATLADRQHTLVPAMIEPCERPIMFELTQTADLVHWDGSPADRNWLAFLADVQQFLRERHRDTAGAPLQPATATAIPAAMSQGPATPKPARAATTDDRPTLAILPFTNRSRDPDDEVFAEGMVEDLTAALSVNPMLRVIARSATLAFRGNTGDLAAIGRQLSVRYLLEGNVRRVGATLRVTAQLVTAETAAILWTQKFDRPLQELAELQESLVLELAAVLGVQVQDAEIERILRKPNDLSAWEAVVRSNVAGIRVTAESMAIAVAEARRAVAIEPDYAPGHVALGHMLAMNHWIFLGNRDTALVREARGHIDRALQLDPNDATVLGRAAEALCLCGAWTEGLRCAEHAFRLHPKSASSHLAMLIPCLRFRRVEEALAHLDAYAQLAPRDPSTSVRLLQRAGAYYMARRHAEALDTIEQALVMNPRLNFALKDRVVYLEALGRRDEAREAVRRLRAVEPGTTLDQWKARHEQSLLDPETSASMFELLRRAWLDTPEEPARA